MKKAPFYLLFGGLVVGGVIGSVGGWIGNDLYKARRAAQKVNGLFSVVDNTEVDAITFYPNSKEEMSREKSQGKQILAQGLEFRSDDYRSHSCNGGTGEWNLTFIKDGREYSVSVGTGFGEKPVDRYFRIEDSTDPPKPKN